MTVAQMEDAEDEDTDCIVVEVEKKERSKC